MKSFLGLAKSFLAVSQNVSLFAKEKKTAHPSYSNDTYVPLTVF